MQLEIVNSLDRLRELEVQWSKLAQTTSYPMLQHTWMLCAAEAYSDLMHLNIFAVWDGELLAGIAPLAQFGSRPMVDLRCIAENVGEPDAFLFSSPKAVEVLVSGIMRSRRALRLSNLSKDGAELLALKSDRSTAFRFERSGAGHAAQLPATVEALDASLSKSARTLLRRKKNRADKYGTVRFSTETLTEVNFESFLSDLIRVEGCGWKARNGTSLSQNERLRRFFESYIRRMAATGALRGDRMMINDVIVAIRLSVRSGGRLYELKIGFDEAYEACSPGIMLTHETLKASIEEGLHAHEFLGVGEDWQRHWPLLKTEQVTVRYYPLSLSGSLMLGKDASKILGGAGKCRLRSKIRATDEKV